MDTKQIEYILKIADENNITKAAEKLFITQPALNQQLIKLEKELGVQLFHRSRTDWRPTEAGLIYLENARQILLTKQNTYKMIQDLTHEQNGNLSVGFTPGRGSIMLSAVYPQFHKEYPNITVSPQELSVKTQQELISKGELDIGFQTLCKKHRTSDEYVDIASEEIMLVVSAKHPITQLYETSKEPFPSIDISYFSNDPFVLMYKQSTIRELINDIFTNAGFTPNVLFETSSNRTILTMIKANICCGFVPKYYLNLADDSIKCFSLPDLITWDIVASYKKDSYLSCPAKRFLEMASEFLSQNSCKI
jgi:Transcriptional regulator